MILAWGFLLRKNFRDLGRNPIWVLVAEMLASATGLAVYWFTSRAIGPALSFGGDFFAYVVWGELALVMPLTLWNGASLQVKSATHDGSLEIFLTLPQPASLLLAAQTLALLPRELFRVLVTLTLASALFGLPVSGTGLFGFALWELSAIPLFLGFGQLGAAVLVRFQRGASALAHLGSLLSVLAGVYFPLTAVPNPLAELSRRFSPFTVLVEGIRHSVDGHVAFLPLLALGLAGVAMATIGALVLEFSFTDLRRRGDPLCFGES